MIQILLIPDHPTVARIRNLCKVNALVHFRISSLIMHYLQTRFSNPKLHIF